MKLFTILIHDMSYKDIMVFHPINTSYVILVITCHDNS